MGKSIGKKLTILLTSHRKPEYLKEAITSVLNQTRKDYILLILDSGDWKGKKDKVSLEMEKIFENLSPEIIVLFTGETEEIRKRAWIYSWAINRVIKSKIIKTPYISFLCDDDLIYPKYVEEMLSILENGKRAVYCSEKRTPPIITMDGKYTEVLLADKIKSGSVFDYNVDYLQVMFETKLLDELDPPWFSEDLANKHHVDGIFLDRLGSITKFYPVKKILCENRITSLSANNPSIKK